MAAVYGTFVFKQLGDGCLASKYCHRKSLKPYTETCVSKSYKSDDSFDGEYDSVWLEEGNSVAVQQSTIKISSQKGNGMFDINWNVLNGGDYKGLGMLFENLLVGHYWSV